LLAEEHGGRHKHYGCRFGSIYFTIQLATDLAAPDPGQSYDFLQLCFTVKNLQAFFERLQSLRITPLHPPQQIEGTSYITLLDPDGRHVRIMMPWQER
jgi:Glyoxalase/Bleomycin resistance protein/Dioxygenase superfamily